jgi:hypothetical protein
VSLITLNFRLGLEIAWTKTEVEMKILMIGLLLMSGLVMAQGPVTQSQHVTESERRALASQSPSVRVHKKHPNKDKYIVKENKSTIVATKAYDK